MNIKWQDLQEKANHHHQVYREKKKKKNRGEELQS